MHLFSFLFLIQGVRRGQHITYVTDVSFVFFEKEINSLLILLGGAGSVARHKSTIVFISLQVDTTSKTYTHCLFLLVLRTVVLHHFVNRSNCGLECGAAYCSIKTTVEEVI